jgi:hypothetical protein
LWLKYLRVKHEKKLNCLIGLLIKGSLYKPVTELDNEMVIRAENLEQVD